MTDKKIIIDGVNVAGCRFLDLLDSGEIWCNNVNISTVGKSDAAYLYCKDNPNCYYKRLQLYKQALEKIKEIALRYVEAQGRYEILEIINEVKIEIHGL